MKTELIRAVAGLEAGKSPEWVLRGLVRRMLKHAYEGDEPTPDEVGLFAAKFEQVAGCGEDMVRAFACGLDFAAAVKALVPPPGKPCTALAAAVAVRGAVMAAAGQGPDFAVRVVLDDDRPGEAAVSFTLKLAGG